MRGKVSQAEVPQLVVYSLTASSTSCGLEPVKERTTSTISRQGFLPQGCGPPKSAASRILRSYSGTTLFQLSVMTACPFRMISGFRSRRSLDAAVVLARKLAPLSDHDIGSIEIF